MRLPSVQDRKAGPLWARAQSYEGEGEHAQAVVFYRQLTRHYPRSNFCGKAEQRIFDILENILYNREELVKECRWWIKKFPRQKNIPEILYKLGRTESSFFLNFPSAEEAYQKIVQKYPQSEYKNKALIGLSDLCYRESRWRELIDLNKQILKDEEIQEKERDWLRFQNGCAYCRLKNYQQAKEEFSQVSNTRMLEECLDYYRAEVEVAPQSPEAHQGLGDFYARQKNFRLAHQCWKRASDLRTRAGVAPLTPE